MTQATGGSPAAVRAMTAPPDGSRLTRARRLPYPELAVAAIAAAVFSWRVGSPSAWWDEAITRGVTSRSPSGILDLAERADVVHLAYYMLVHVVVGPNASITAIRLLSVAGAVGTAALLVTIGRELGSRRVGILAGLMWVAAPLASRYAQEARPYALVTFATTASTLALLRVCHRPWQRRRWVAYTASLIAVGLLNLLSLLVIVVHLAVVLAAGSAPVRRRWGISLAVTGAALLPLIVVALRQRGQVSWLPRPTFAQLLNFLHSEYSAPLLVVVIIVVALAGLGRGTHAPSLGLGLAWALLPPAVLWSISQVHPLFDWRYVLFSLPGTALAMASIATLLRLRWGIAVLLVLAVGGWHMQHVYRRPATGHAEDTRGAAEMVATGARPGDAILFLPASRRVVALGYPEDFRSVDDVALARDAESSATLWGVERPADEIAEALEYRSRIWVVTGPPRLGEGAEPEDVEKERLLTGPYRLAQVSDTARYEIRLYVRRPPVSMPK